MGRASRCLRQRAGPEIRSDVRSDVSPYFRSGPWPAALIGLIGVAVLGAATASAMSPPAWVTAHLETPADAAVQTALNALFPGAPPRLGPAAFVDDGVITLEPGARVRPEGKRADGRLPGPPAQIRLETNGSLCRLVRTDTGSTATLAGVTCAPDARN